MNKILLLLLLVTVLCLSLFSCVQDGPTVPGEDPGEEESNENLIYEFGSSLYLRFDSEHFDEAQVEDILNSFYNYDQFPRFVSLDRDMQEHEIVFGNLGCEISDAAYSRLELMEKTGEDDGRFLIYSDGSSVAIAYDEEYGDFTKTIALNYFLENYVKEELFLEPGVVYQERFNLLDKLGELDEKYYDAAWKKMENVLGADGAEVVAAFKSFYELYDGEKIITWLVGQYDPSICVCHGLDGEMECKKTKYCGTAGFYYARSSRDYTGFLPDAESTSQALNILGNCGITTGLSSGGYSAVVPEDMAKKICDFLYNLQDPDGFFYHPQWGKNIGDSRRGRDHSWCTGILGTYGVPLKYSSSSSYRSEYALPGALGNSAVYAVSKVVNTAGFVLPAHLQSIEAWKNYLKNLDIENRSYNAGNTLSAQSTQIYAAGQEYIDVMIEEILRVYNKHNNGTFHHTVNYYAINGVMKLVGQLSGQGISIPNPELTARACFAAISSDESVKDIVDIWNPWVAFNRCVDNIEKCHPDSVEAGKKMVLELKNDLYSDYAEAIIASKEKLSLFKKADGSFSYCIGRTSTTSQGAHVSVAHIDEGDVNATIMGTNSFTYEMFTLVEPMGLGRIPFALTRERYLFYKLVNNAQPVRKIGAKALAVETLDFDDEEIGTSPIGPVLKSSADANKYGRGTKFVADNRVDSTGNILSFNSIKGRSDYFTVENGGTLTGATCQVFEGEFCFESISEGEELFCIELGESGDKGNAYRLTTKVSGNKIFFLDTSSVGTKTEELGINVDLGEWFKLRVEYYLVDSQTAKIKIYINDNLAAVSDNYYTASANASPSASLKQTRVYASSDCEITLLCDNIKSYAQTATYTPEALAE